MSFSLTPQVMSDMRIISGVFTAQDDPAERSRYAVELRDAGLDEDLIEEDTRPAVDRWTVGSRYCPEHSQVRYTLEHDGGRYHIFVHDIFAGFGELLSHQNQRYHARLDNALRLSGQDVTTVVSRIYGKVADYQQSRDTGCFSCLMDSFERCLMDVETVDQLQEQSFQVSSQVRGSSEVVVHFDKKGAVAGVPTPAVQASTVEGQVVRQ